jgi:hypothetical protein
VRTANPKSEVLLATDLVIKAHKHPSPGGSHPLRAVLRLLAALPTVQGPIWILLQKGAPNRKPHFMFKQNIILYLLLLPLRTKALSHSFSDLLLKGSDPVVE